MLTDSSLTDTAPTLALDYDSLRREGIAWLEKLADSEWTDFNAHDPGITILEQVCYALTDLSYRINYDMEDLLSREGEDTYDSLYLPRHILVTKPVTLLDLRKLVIDVEGVKNAWLEPVPLTESLPLLFYHEKPALETGAKVIDLTGGEGANALPVQGLYRVLIEKSIDTDSNILVGEVSERLHAQRGLAVDFDNIQVIESQDIQLQTSIEIDPNADPEEVYLAILEKISAYLSPGVRFYTLEECLAQGKPIDEIFDGPLLDHGFIDNQELIRLKRKNNLYISDLIREIMDVGGVRMVEYVAFKHGEELNDTALVLDADKTPNLDVSHCKLILKKRQLPLQLATGMLIERYWEKQKIAIQRTLADSNMPLPQGRDRHVARHYSLLQQFPKVYGIGETGLPSNVSEQRKAEAKQLKAYLLFFDQLLANSFAQLAHIRDLLSFYAEQPDSYFAATLDDPGIRDLWVEQNNGTRQKRLQQILGKSVPEIFGSSVQGRTEVQQSADWQRKHRFINHLLARFAEPFTDYSGFGDYADAKKQVPLSKLALLREYPQISSRKGTGFNVLAVPSKANRSGLEQMLRLKLGVLETSEEKIYVLEHALLRPMTGDTLQQAPLLSNALSPDPYSLQLSVIFFATASRSDDFKRFVEQTVREETPAHLIVYVRWMAVAEANRFDAAYQDWQQQHLAYRMLSIQRILNNPKEPSTAIPLRDARDRLIDWIGLGQTYPLRDLAVTAASKVAYNIKAGIFISNSQKGVSYRLCDDQQNALESEIPKEGNGGTLELTTPAILTNRIFSIQATKLSNGLKNVLLQTHTAIVGLDKDLIATIQSGQPLLAGSTPAPDDARIVDYGVTVSVAIEKAQEGVDYQLIKIDGGKETLLSDAVLRESDPLVLVTTAGVTEDIDIRIRATKKFAVSENKDTETELLATVLPLKVRANTALNVSLLTPIIDYSSATRIKIQGSQTTALYRVLTPGIADHDFIHGAANLPLLTIPVPGKEAVTIRTPKISRDFANTTEANAVPGNGGDLVLSTSTLTADSFIVVQAIKNHLVKNGGIETVPSSVPLSQVTAVLVRPDANPALRFKATIADSILQAPIQVSGGQAGVFYEFTSLADNQVQGLPVYFHQRDRDDNTQNKGIEQLQVEVDLVIPPALLKERLTANPDIAGLSPEPPELSTDVSLKNDDELSIRAIKAQTGVEVVFKRTLGELLT